jgi:hypothetical protein
VLHVGISYLYCGAIQFPLHECQTPNDALTIFSMLYSREFMRLLYLELILVAECFSLDLPCGGSHSKMLTALKHLLMASINSLMTAFMASIHGIHSWHPFMASIHGIHSWHPLMVSINASINGLN